MAAKSLTKIQRTGKVITADPDEPIIFSEDIIDEICGVLEDALLPVNQLFLLTEMEEHICEFVDLSRICLKETLRRFRKELGGCANE